jgi:hypothetical protein
MQRTRAGTKTAELGEILHEVDSLVEKIIMTGTNLTKPSTVSAFDEQPSLVQSNTPGYLFIDDLRWENIGKSYGVHVNNKEEEEYLPN